MDSLPISAIADQYAWLYTSLPAPDNTWDKIIPTDGAYVAVKNVAGTDYVMFRGSTTFLDWIEDFAAFAIPLETDALGGVHPGFYSGTIAVRTVLDRFLGPKVVLVGHSLGAGHAALYAGLRLAAGKPVDKLIMFGEPRAGGAKLASVLTPLAVESYRNADSNGHDLVTDVPVKIQPLLNYQHPRELIDVSHSPSVNDKWGLFRYHHMGHYARALGATGPAALSLPV